MSNQTRIWESNQRSFETVPIKIHQGDFLHIGANLSATKESFHHEPWMNCCWSSFPSWDQDQPYGVSKPNLSYLGGEHLFFWNLGCSLPGCQGFNPEQYSHGGSHAGCSWESLHRRIHDTAWLGSIDVFPLKNG
jgi:hypothetical protein